MKTLANSARRVAKEGGGTYLPAAFTALESAGIRVRMGTATFIMGPAGAFKTGFTVAYVLKLGLPTLYCSADAEDFEIVERVAANVTGTPMNTVSKDHAQYAEALAGLEHLRFCFDDSPTYDDLVLEICAYAEVFGDFPKVIVIDTLMKVTGQNEDEWASLRDTAQVIHKIARVTGAAVLVLAHASDDRTDPTTPAPRKSLQGKVSQLPKVILSVALHGDELRICPVKTKWGREDPSGQMFTTLYVDPSTNRVFGSRYEMEHAS